MRRKLAVLVLSTALGSFGLLGFSAPAQACAEIDPAIGCIGPCARPLQGSPTCPTSDDGGKGNGNGGRP
ncbi:MAG: hypothetical protein ACLGHL_07575 [Actinomycetota bacterium]